MRNLSKVLALVLSLAFVLTMFAGAITDKGVKKYADEAELTAAGGEAVAVLSALGVTEGYPDGTFRGAENVTRAEYAAMLSRAVAGTDVQNFYSVSAMNDFSDEIDAWAIPYLNYAYLNQIMVGYGDGTIRAKSNVTGFEAVKMTLVGLGYDPKVEGLEGSAWQSNTARLANKVGLLANLQSENLYNAFDREANAILIRNAIYTETVSYVGSSATGTGLTLGEKVFDLIDVRGIIVANDQGAIGLNWVDVLTNATNFNKGSFIQYEAAASGQTRFAYRDYTGAATEGGYYVPRVITTDIDSDKNELGRAYRILATGAKNPANTNEVRKVYGVLGEIESDASYAYKTSGIKGDFIDAMLKSAQTIDPLVTEDSVQKNIFLNGKAVSYKDAKAALGKITKSTAPYYYVDNDGDGIYDFMYLYTLTPAKVLSVADGKITLAGLGTKDVIGGLEGIEAGDYIAYWTDGQYGYVKELETYVGKVTAFTKNSGDQPLTYLNGTYTINGKNYTFGALANELGADERTYFEQLMGLGSAAVADASLQFVFDGSYIVAAFVTDETHWENYAVVIGYNWDTFLGMGHVRLLAEDNEYKDFYVASYNGEQIYNTIVSWSGVAPTLINKLVRYEEIGNSQIALYSADYRNASSQYGTAGMFFDATTGMWEAHEYWQTGIQNGTLYNWKNGVVFVSYGKLLDAALTGSNAKDPANVLNGAIANDGAYQWRAYLYGEFQPRTEDEAGAPAAFARKLTADEIVYATALNGVRTLKAAAIVFDGNATLYTLPGLPLRAGQAIWGTVMSATNISTVTDEAKTKYAFQVKILKPWNGGTETITVYSDVRLATFVTGNIYKMFVDGDGICRRWELAASGANAYDNYGTDYLELGRYVITAVLENGDGSYYFVAKKGITNAVSPSGIPNTFAAENVKLYVGKDADLYFVKNLFKTSIEAVNDITAYGLLGNLSFANHRAYYAYFDINPATNEILSGWIDTAAVASYKITNVPITVKYDTNKKEATYIIDPAYGAFFKGGVKEIKVPCEVYELKAPVGDGVLVDLNLTYDDKGAWYVDGADGIGGYTWEYYDATNAAGVDYGTAGELHIDVPKATMNDAMRKYYLNAMPNTNKDTQGFFDRQGTWVGVHPAYGDTKPFPVTDAAAVYFPQAGAAGQGNMNVAAADPWNNNYGYNPDDRSNPTVDAYTYESFWVLYNNRREEVDASGAKEWVADAAMIVYVDEQASANVGAGGSILWPYN